MQRTTVGSILRSTQAYCLQLCEKETLDYGIVYYNPRYASLPDVNQFREVLIEDPDNIPQAYQQAQQWFQQHRLTCHRWAPADGQMTEALCSFLADQGFTQRTFTAMALTRWPDWEPAKHIRILPARAMRIAYREILASTLAIEDASLSDLTVEACEERLNDPQYDMFVALVNHQPVGKCALYQVGDIARVMDLSVDESRADSGIERTLIAHALALARRLTMQNVYVLIEHENTRLQKGYEQLGFFCDGEIVEYHRAPSTSAELPS